MSCYEWESGEIKLPTKIFAKFRREYINKYNLVQQQKLDRLKNIRNVALRQGKGKRMYSFFDCMVSDIRNDTEYDLIYKMFPNGKDKGVKPITPTKKMLNFVNGKTFTFDIDDGCASITFHQKTRSVSWYVEENNHAIESARQTGEANAFFIMLRNVSWTRGSGGSFIGNNEYNRDDYSDGGGGNYTTATYGKE